jgi:polyisoprenoid-binding protein YceI
MNTLCERSEPSVAAIDHSNPNLTGTWTIDPAANSASFTWRNLRLWTMTGRLHRVGVVHLDAPPPVGVVQFEQPSGLPILTIALDPASVETHDADLDARLLSPELVDVLRHRWWLLHSESLEILPSGAWRVMATLTANGTAAAVELRVEFDPAASSPTWLVMRGRGLLDRRAFGIGRPASTFSRQLWLDLAVRARRVGAHPPDAGMLSPSTPPIGRYRRVPVQVHQADPDAPEVARRLIALIATRWPATPAEHVGSSAVPGLAGKGIIDLLLAAHPAHALGHLPPPGHRVPGPRARGPSLQPGGRRHARLPGRLAGRSGPASPLRGPQAGDCGRWAG